MKKTILLILAFSLCAPWVAFSAGGPLAALEQHYRWLETGDFDKAREQIHSKNLQPEDVEVLPRAMQALSDELAQGGGFGQIKITQKTPCEAECVLIGLLVLKDGTRKPNAWKMILVGGNWKTTYSRQLIAKHKKQQ